MDMRYLEVEFESGLCEGLFASSGRLLVPNLGRQLVAVDFRG